MNKKKTFWIVFAVIAAVSFIIYAFYYEIRDRILYWDVDIPALTKAAEEGDVKAQSTLGYYYAAGKGVKPNKAESLKWDRMAAEQGDAMAQYSLGCSYLEGNGVPKDKTEAEKWLRKAAAQDHQLAKELLNQIEE